MSESTSTKGMQVLETVVHLFHPRRSNNHRSRILHTDGLLSIVAVVIGFALFSISSPMFDHRFGDILGYATDITVQTVVDQTNAKRAEVGLPPLTYNQQLSNAAAAKATDMFVQQYWAHTSPAGVTPWTFIGSSGYRYASAGENLARDFMSTPDVMAAWMASPTHRDNIVDARFQDIGVAVVNGELQGVETTLVVQMFGRPAATSQQALIPEVAAATLETEETRVQPLDEPSMEQTSTPTVLLTSVTESPKDMGTVSPLQLSKAFGIAVVVVLLLALTYDNIVAEKKRMTRLVGKNIAHIIYFVAVGAVLVLFRGGLIG